jgi:hypothetical protein
MAGMIQYKMAERFMHKGLYVIWRPINPIDALSGVKNCMAYNWDMPDANTPIQREGAYTEGKRAFDEYKGWGYNLYTSSNQELLLGEGL